MGANTATQLRGTPGGVAFPCALAEATRISTSRIAQTSLGSLLARNRRRSISSTAEFAGGIRVLREASTRARERMLALETLARQCDELAAMDFSFLFDPARDLFSIGFNVTEGRRDASFYDLLASEARLCSYVAIAQGQVPQDHWFSLGRLLVAPRGEPILVSWSGSMFEYLMPLLVMPNYGGTLLDQACKAAVERQIEYGKRAASRGAFPNRATTGPMCTSIISTAPSACPGWV